MTLFTPLARHCAGVHPNTITLISLLAGCLAGAAFCLAHFGRGFFLIGGLLVGISGAADSLDGIVARKYGRTSRKGDFLDHFCDRLVNLCIFVGLAFAPRAEPVLGLLVVLLVMLNSYLGTQIEASFGSRYYVGLGKAELFVGLIAGSILLWLAPAFSVSLGHLSLSLLNLFFIVLGLMTLAAIGQRFRFALGLARDDDEGREP